jgi:hypothetical protein
MRINPKKRRLLSTEDRAPVLQRYATFWYSPDWDPRIRSTAIIVIRRYAWIRPTQTRGFCCMKPNGPIPIIQPIVVVAALPSATKAKIVP